MLVYQSTTSAFQMALRDFNFHKKENLPFPELFAIRRFERKFQVPNTSTVNLKQKCWDDWLVYDQQLVRVKTSDFLRFPVLYRVREVLKTLGRPRLDTYDFPKGSEFFATRGQNSLESRLQRSRWTCTHDNFELFARFVYGCKAMKRAFRQRYNRWYQSRSFVESRVASDKNMFRRYKALGYANPQWECFLFKLSCIVDFVQGSRFSSVPKNNDTERPINIEAIGNIVVQRQMGNWFREELKRLFGIDLDTLADLHRIKIRFPGNATIDLKNASDSITLILCQFLLPRRVFSFLQRCRSDLVFGLDKAYHRTEKISSMGNGFTFELMTLILVAVARQFDPDASVFGDDIIISDDKALDLIDVLEGVGFHVNKDKSFIKSKFRESCGANYHDDFGYIESFDFRWPEHVHDCVVFYNKALRLSRLYPSFERLRLLLRRHIPKALQGIVETDFFTKEVKPTMTNDSPPELSSFFRVREHSDRMPRIAGFQHKLVTYAERYNYDIGDLKVFKGVVYRERLRSHTLSHLSPQRHYGKYEMYLFAGRKAKDVLMGYGDWVSCLFLSVAGSTMRWTDSALE